MENISEQIIELVHVNPCIYDKRDPKYKDVRYKEMIWEEIGKQIKLLVKECKVKWKSLRDRYRKEKISEDLPSGSSQKVGVPWKYMQSLDFFLAESHQAASTTSNISEELESNVEWLQEENSCHSFRSTGKKQKNEDLFNDVLIAMKTKYEAPQSKSMYENFFGMLEDKFSKLSESDVDDVQLEILQLVNRKINTSKY